MTSPLKVIGLTGGIASGKSAVALSFREIGIPVLDADSLGHMILEPGQPAYDKVIETFGTSILGEDSKLIDRKKLGKMVFEDEDLRTKLEEITHPAIAAMAVAGLKLIESRGEKFAIYEAALLVETGIYKGMESLIVVKTSLENQLVRLCGRDQISKKDASIKIATQLPLDDKLKVADYTISNNGSYEDLDIESRKLGEILKKRFA